jgi:hypothetical protein
MRTMTRLESIIRMGLEEYNLSEQDIEDITFYISRQISNRIIIKLENRNNSLKRQLRECENLKERKVSTEKTKRDEGPEPGKENWDFLM